MRFKSSNTNVSNNYNNISVNGDIPRKMDGTHHIMRYIEHVPTRRFVYVEIRQRVEVFLFKWLNKYTALMCFLPLDSGDFESNVFILKTLILTTLILMFDSNFLNLIDNYFGNSKNSHLKK